MKSVSNIFLVMATLSFVGALGIGLKNLLQIKEGPYSMDFSVLLSCIGLAVVFYFLYRLCKPSSRN